jgi:hypothetical protein
MAAGVLFNLEAAADDFFFFCGDGGGWFEPSSFKSLIATINLAVLWAFARRRTDGLGAGGRGRAFFRLKIRGKEARRSRLRRKTNRGFFFLQKHRFLIFIGQMFSAFVSPPSGFGRSIPCMMETKARRCAKSNRVIRTSPTYATKRGVSPATLGAAERDREKGWRGCRRSQQNQVVGGSYLDIEDMVVKSIEMVITTPSVPVYRSCTYL